MTSAPAPDEGSNPELPPMKPRLPAWAMTAYMAVVIAGVTAVTLRLAGFWSLAILPGLLLLYWLVWRRFDPPLGLEQWSKCAEQWGERPGLRKVSGTILLVLGVCLSALEVLAMIEGATRRDWRYVALQLGGIAIAVAFVFLGRRMRTHTGSPKRAR